MDNNQREALRAAVRASERAATIVHARLKRGLSSLATISSTAPWFGVLGTVIGIVTSFRGLGTDKTTALAVIGGLLGQSLVPTGIGLLTALVAFGSYKYLSATLHRFDGEMHTATLQMMNDLAIRCRTTNGM